jgi:hypothetical protein
MLGRPFPRYSVLSVFRLSLLSTSTSGTNGGTLYDYHSRPTQPTRCCDFSCDSRSGDFYYSPQTPVLGSIFRLP